MGPRQERASRRRRSGRGHGALALLCVGALGPAIAGAVLLARAREARAVRQAELGGLTLRVDRAIWVDHERDHAGSMPSWLMPGMPAQGRQRLAIRFTVSNSTPREQRFRWGELVFRAGDAEARADGAEIALPPGHAVHLPASFDAPDSPQPVTFSWERAGAAVRLVSTRAPEHAPRAAPAPDVWPRETSALPRGHPAAGAALYRGRLACASCHGDPERPGSNDAGPFLGGIAEVAGARQSGKGAAQYLYESLLDPDAFIAPECAGGPCARPSAMPRYGEVLSLQDAADLVAFLLEQRGTRERLAPR